MPDLMACMRRENSFSCGNARYRLGPGQEERRQERASRRQFRTGGTFVPPPSAQGLRVWREKVERANKEELVTQYNGIFKMPALLS